MKGLFLYYNVISVKKVIFGVLIGFLVVLIGLMESTHELVIAYACLLPMTLFPFSDEDKKRNTIFEKMIPLKHTKIVITKYILLLGSTIISALLLIFYLVIITFLKMDVVHLNELITFSIGTLCLSTTMGVSCLLYSCMEKKNWQKYLLLIVPCILTFLFLYDSDENNFFILVPDIVSSQKVVILILLSFLYYLVSSPIANYFQKKIIL